jgi:hypothetical protein
MHYDVLNICIASGRPIALASQLTFNKIALAKLICQSPHPNFASRQLIGIGKCRALSGPIREDSVPGFMQNCI